MLKNSSLLRATPFMLAAFGVFPANQASATIVNCGDTIVADTTLDAKLGPCAGDGIIIGADGITLDLNGFNIEGSGGPTAFTGVLVSGFDNVRIHNGSIAEFGVGVQLSGDFNTVEDLVIDNAFGYVGTAGTGAIVIFGRENTVQNNQIGGTTNGIHITGLFADDNIVTQNDVRLPCDFGVVVSPTGTSENTGSSITDNLVTGCNFGGIVIEHANTTNGQNIEISDNEVTNIAGPGILVETDGNQVVGNTVLRSAVGIHVDAPDNLVRQNTSSENSLQGILLSNSATNTLVSANTVEENLLNGIEVESSANTLRRNDVLDNDQNGIVVWAGNNTLRFNTTDGNAGHGVVIEGGDGNLVGSGTANENLASGVFVADLATNTMVFRTLAKDNDASGFKIEGLVTMKDNRARKNTNFGYNTLMGGVTDLGGNKASGNGAQNCSTPADFPNSPLAC